MASSFIPRPRSLYRLGEHPVWDSAVFEAGCAVSRVEFFRSPLGVSKQAFETHAVTWEIYAQDEEDFDFLRWEGALAWNFGATGLDIAPLSSYSGTRLDLLVKEDVHILERLGELGEGPRRDGESFGSFRLGKYHFFRGLQSYIQHPVLTPAGHITTVSLSFRNGQIFLPSQEVRVRVLLNGVSKSVIPVG